MRRDVLILIGLFIALAAFIALGPGRSVSDSSAGTHSSHSSGRDGALALYRWLGSMGYEVERLQYRAFTPLPEADLLVVLSPRERISREEAEAVAAWVEAGGTLLVAEKRAGAFGAAAPLLEAFGLELTPAPDEAGLINIAPALQPALSAPPALRLRAQTAAVFRSERDDIAPLAGVEGGPVLIGLQAGEGYVYASSAAHPFSNTGLGEADNAALVLNILRRVPPGGRIVFDEVHHGFVSQPSLRALLLGTPWGWAILYTAATIAAYLALTGRRFGRAVPLKAEAQRRSSAEYLESMAGLLRRAGKLDYAQAHFHASLKRRLARAHGLNPRLEDAAFVESLAETNPALARAAQEILARLAAPIGSEAELLRTVAAADELLR